MLKISVGIGMIYIPYPAIDFLTFAFYSFAMPAFFRLLVVAHVFATAESDLHSDVQYTQFIISAKRSNRWYTSASEL